MAVDPIPHVVIVGAGFGGLEVARGFAKTDVRITVIDSRTITCSNRCSTRSPRHRWRREIARPIRSLLRWNENITTLLGKVVGVDTQAKKVVLPEDGGAITFDMLALTTGARHAYFGHEASVACRQRLVAGGS